MKQQRRRRSRERISGLATGEFVSVRLTRNHVTLMIEGRDQDGLSVAGTALSLPSLDQLITRLTNVRRELVARTVKLGDLRSDYDRVAKLAGKRGGVSVVDEHGEHRFQLVIFSDTLKL